MSHNTIAAIATPLGTGGVGIVRISGSESWDIAQRLSQRQKPFTHGQIQHGWCIDPSDKHVIDEVLFLPFQAPHSFTGEEVVEIHCHGGMVLTQQILSLVLREGALLAQPGEFTQRAVYNGKLDLTQAESTLDLIHAQGEALIKLAAQNLKTHALSRFIHTLLHIILQVQADIVAHTDFPDEVDEPDRALLAQQLDHLSTELSTTLAQQAQQQVLRTGVDVAIVGKPNAGKSALFNALLATERAIVTDIPGTTRDVLREQINLNGVPFLFHDTAGLRETADPVEQIGVQKTQETLSNAQVILYIVDSQAGLSTEDQETLAQLRLQKGILVANKTDLNTLDDTALPTNWPICPVSAQSGQGLEALKSTLFQLALPFAGQDNLQYLLSQRQLDHLSEVSVELKEATMALQSPHVPLDMVTMPLTNALYTLQALLGKDTTELVLDSVFSRFCVGK